MLHACLLAYGRKQNSLRWRRKGSGGGGRRNRMGRRRRSEVGGGWHAVLEEKEEAKRRQCPKQSAEIKDWNKYLPIHKNRFPTRAHSTTSKIQHSGNVTPSARGWKTWTWPLYTLLWGLWEKYKLWNEWGLDLNSTALENQNVFG